MVAARYGKSDPDVKHKGSKEKTDKAMLKASTKLPTTGMVGGVANSPGNPSEKKAGKVGSPRGK